MPRPQPLNYAPRPPMYKLRRFRRWFYLITLLAAASSGWWWMPLAWRRAELLYWQHQCLKYSPPPDTLAFDEARPTPVVPHEWLKFYALFSPPGLSSGGTIYLHAMSKSNREKVLVAVDMMSMYDSPGLHLFVRTFSPDTLLHRAMQKSGTSYRFDIAKSARVFAGQTDASDPGHFTFRESDNQGETIYDGWLQDDGSVVIGPRAAAANAHP